MCKMSGLLRQRGHGVSVTPSGSPPVDNLQGLSAALRKARETASASGLSQEELAHCVSKLVKTRLKNQQNENETEPAPKKSRSCCSKLYCCFKVVWIVWLFLLAVSTIVMLHRPSGHVVHNVRLSKLFWQLILNLS